MAIDLDKLAEELTPAQVEQIGKKQAAKEASTKQLAPAKSLHKALDALDFEDTSNATATIAAVKRAIKAFDKDTTDKPAKEKKSGGSRINVYNLAGPDAPYKVNIWYPVSELANDKAIVPEGKTAEDLLKTASKSTHNDHLKVDGEKIKVIKRKPKMGAKKKK